MPAAAHPLSPQASPAPVREVLRRLARRFGPLDPPRRWDPLDELILTVLSQNTSDVNSDRAFQSLKDRYPTWEDVADADQGELADAIRGGGLANVKAPRILSILEEIRRREDGSLDLSWMHEAPTKRVRHYLLGLPGVGPKTAACVLAFSLGRPALPVDTHVHRVARRLGWLPEGIDAARAHRVVEELIPPRSRIPAHVGLIRLGRAICRAGRPACATCPLQDVCPTAPWILGAVPAGEAGERQA